MLKIENLSVCYGKHQALSDITMTVPMGQILGIVGPNGAGKTTLFRVLARCVEKYSGSISLMGKAIDEIDANAIGYLADKPFQFPFFSPLEMLLFERTMKHPQLPEEEVLRMLNVLELDSFMHKPLNTLSSGLKKRVSVAAAFLGSPSLIILDEPLNSLDIQTVIILKRLIQAALSNGTIILMSSHVLDFFDGLITRIVFLKHGVIFHTSVDDSKSAEEIYAKLFLTP